MAERLERLRDRAHNQMLVIKRFAESITEGTSIEQIITRLEVLETRYNAFNDIEVQLFEYPNYQPITEAVDDVYYKTRALLTKASGKYMRRENSATHELNTTLEQFIEQQKTFYEGVNMSQHVRLPKINIEPFSGDYKSWSSFQDLFITTVHNNQNVSDVHKLQMLKGVLSGEAASLIRHIAVTENNYAEAWDKLCNRYNKKNPIVTSLIQTFGDQKVCSQANGKDLRHLAETSDEIIRGLRALGPNAETRDPWIIHILLSKIDNETKQMWANEFVGKDFPTIENLIEFLNKRCDALEVCGVPTKKFGTKSTTKSFVTNSNHTFECLVCRQPHPLFRCPEFKNKTVDVRSKFVTENDLCGNCLKKGHSSVQCFSKSCCLICNKRHHTMLHPTQLGMPAGTNQPSSSHHIIVNESTSGSSPQYTLKQAVSTSESKFKADSSHPYVNYTKVLHTLYSSPTTVLPTAIVFIKSRTGELQLFRALLDSGSQTTFVTESCAQCLGLQRSQSSISIYGLASTAAGQTKGKVNMTIYSHIDKLYNFNVTAHIIKNITSFIPTKTISFKHELLGVQLADPQFYKPNKIDLLLGADIFFEILLPEKRKVDGCPILQSTKLGWLVAGTFADEPSNIINLHATTESIIRTSDDDLHLLLKRFWEVEEVGLQINTAMSANWCEEYYQQTTTRNANGRFVVKLPFKDPRLTLGKSFAAAQQRLLAMERKFAKDPEFVQAYHEFINEYIALGHMTLIPCKEIPQHDDMKYYLPHHAVIKPSSTTTKLRVVFDASSKTSTQVSLNDILRIGPNIQTDLSTIILRFRVHAIAVVADIEKMYRQICVTSDDANFQMILWREKPNQELKTYKLNTVTYGTACAPYLAVRSLKKSTENFQLIFPKATQVISNDFYIDDLLTGCETVSEAVVLKQQLIQILGNSGFNLRKWKSNSLEFLNSFPTKEIQNIPKLIEDDPKIKTLGIMWNAVTDSFSFKVHQCGDNINWTKRKILSSASKVYDPMGWLAPTIIMFKILLQKIWLLKIDWDACLPNHIINTWQSIYQSLPELESIEIPRCMTNIRNPRRLQLHAFCDASEAAYGCVIYLRATNDEGEITTNIIYAKSKVAPIRQISLPRLELCGAVLLCKSVKFCMESFTFKDIDVFAWTDSMIVLHWLSDVPRRWTSFIGNRTAIILESVPRSNWQHIQSKHNPADVLSRGVKPQGLSKLDLWWHGPHWLSEEKINWPQPKPIALKVDDACLEQRSKYINVLTEILIEDVMFNILTRISSWLKIRKIIVYILRFGNPKRRKQLADQQNKLISPIELNDAEILIIRNLQQNAFKTELTILAKNSSLPSKNQLSPLDPFVDSNGLLRVGGRLRNSLLPYSAKHPIIIPKNHIVCERIVQDIHVKHMHAGNSLTLSILRNKFWMIGARYTIKRFIKSCTICIRYRRWKSEQKMADLPAVRCIQCRPFSKIGLDYAGPLYIKTSKRRNSPIEKAYVAVFVCLVVKAVHLEVVSSLDTDSFLAALKRFIARRGSPEQIWCDNGSNFIGANRELKKLKQQIINQLSNSLISEFLLQKSIVFHFNPPHAPHFGGLWEASVKSFKYHLKRVTNVNLSFEEMTTLIIQIESLLNSRPLCRLNDDPANLEVLTPAHFLVGESLTAIPEPNLNEVPVNTLSRWQNVQQRLQGFWNRWHRDYLTTLQQRYKWKSPEQQLEVNDVVLISEDNLYPSQWMLGKITAIHPGSDGITRVVTLRTSKNEVKRPVNKLIKLPIKS